MVSDVSAAAGIARKEEKRKQHAALAEKHAQETEKREAAAEMAAEAAAPVVPKGPKVPVPVGSALSSNPFWKTTKSTHTTVLESSPRLPNYV